MVDTISTPPGGTPRLDAPLLDGRYRLLEVIGQGGYSRVHRAEDTTLHRTVAIKLFTTDGADAADRGRMASEMRVLAALSHPSLVTLFDGRIAADTAYLAMELVDGPTLHARLGSGPLSATEAARVAGELVEALRVIHARGIVHRDIKPSNVLLRPAAYEGGAPRAMLADFGIAALVDAGRLTVTGTLVGTAAYLSPEQARGERPAPPTDVYSLGLVLLEALTGVRAFDGGTPHEVLVARLHRAPEIPDSLPPAWRALLAAMTAMDPAHRPDAAAVARAVSRLPEGDAAVSAVLATPTAVTAPADPVVSEEPAAPAPPAAASRRWWIVAAAAIVLIFGAAVVVAILGGVFEAPAEPSLPAVPTPLQEHLDELWRQVGP